MISVDFLITEALECCGVGSLRRALWSIVSWPRGHDPPTPLSPSAKPGARAEERRHCSEFVHAMLSRSGNVITKCSAFLFVASCSCCARGFAGLCKRKIYGTFVICSNWSLYNSKECNVSLQKDRVSRHVAAYLNDSECIQH